MTIKQEMWAKRGYQVLEASDVAGRCRFCGAKMEIEGDTETETTWKHPEPVENEQCDSLQVVFK